MADYDVVVIGAGCGGLSAGSILARQGRKVLVVEQQDRVGGCCSTFDRDGFKFDVGASVVEVIHPIETAFNELGTSFFNECDLIPVDPIYSYIEPNGNHIDYPVSIEETRKVYEQIDPHDAESWTKMTDYFFDMINKLIKVYAVSPANNPLDMVKMVMKYPGMLKFVPLFFRSYQDVLEKYFRNPIILETMAFQSYYVGLPPELCPGYVALIPYSEHEGIYYPRGGMIKIPQAFQRVGESFGMEVRMKTLIDKVLVRNRRVEGVRLSDGTEISCDIVVSDTHALNLYFKLIGEEHLPLLPKLGLKTIKPSMGSPMIYLGLDYKPPLTAHHSLTIESMDLMNDYWWNYHLKGKLPPEPFSLICWTSDTDPGMAPEGQHVLNIMNVGPYHLTESNWDTERKLLADRVINYLDGFAVPGLADHVVYQEVCTPPDMEKMLLNPEGSIYGINMDLPNSVVFRPSSKSKAVKGLYLTGASTHPGGGVPTVTASGYVAAKLIEKYEK